MTSDVDTVHGLATTLPFTVMVTSAENAGQINASRLAASRLIFSVTLCIMSSTYWYSSVNVAVLFVNPATTGIFDTINRA